MSARFAPIALSLLALALPSAAVKLPTIFADHMVVQQDVKVPVWGWAAPGEEITVTLGDRSAKAKADASGKWSLKLKAFKADGKALIMTVKGQNTITIQDVLVGEVWLCSGQSNMEFPVVEAANAPAEIAAASFPAVRMFTVQKATSKTPLDTCIGSWRVCSPATVGTFSAVGYFFGRALHQDLKVPVGLIHTSWGGTPAEAWTSEPVLRADTMLSPMFTAIEKTRAQTDSLRALYTKIMAEWEKSVAPLRDAAGKLPERQVDIGNKGFDSGWAAGACDESRWKEMPVPGQWEQVAGLNIDGAVWFRKHVEVPKSWEGKDLRLTLGAVDDFDVTYWNNTKVGATGIETPSFWSAQRVYTVPAALVKAGPAVIAVRVFDHWGGGGFSGQPSQMRLSAPADTGIALAGVWKYRIERELPPLMPPNAPGGVAPQNEPAQLYNAMLRPLEPYAVKGAIWYQGESNAGRAFQYRRLLPAMITNWRADWAQGDFPFGIVQLANFMAATPGPGPSAWAELRDAQLLTARALKNAGLAVAIDIGEGDNIHPRNKQETGRRLALWALATAYGKKIEYSGPLYKAMQLKADTALLSFDHAAGLAAKGDSLKGFAVAGADSHFVWAHAAVRGEQVAVWSEKVKGPLAVRYGWADNPVCNLYNKDGLPASPFRTDSWVGLTDRIR
jgi:sialate O-acetylesterase